MTDCIGMKKKIGIIKIWIESFELIAKHPIILFPFITAAFLEGLAVEFVYFSSRKPLVSIFGPIVRKFFGEGYLHYPGHLLLLPNFFYYVQVVIYVCLGALLAGISMNIFKNIKEGLPLKLRALVMNGFKQYEAFFIYGAIIIAMSLVVKEVDTFVYVKGFKLILKHLPVNITKLFYPCLTTILFLTTTFLQALLILYIPLIVIQKKPILKAFGLSIWMGLVNIFKLFTIVLVPYLLYLPVVLLKIFLPLVMDKTVPEISLYITGLGIVLAIFVDCFVYVCAGNFLLEKEKNRKVS